MTTITELSTTVQTLFTSVADDLAKATGFVQRQRKVTGAGFAQTAVFGLLANPASTREELNQTAASVGLYLSTPGLDHRFTPKAAVFFDALLHAALDCLVETLPTAASVLRRFNGVYVSDTTLVELVPSLAAVWQGANGDADATVKVAVKWELVGGGLRLWLSDGRGHDQRTGVVAAMLPPGSLRLNDLGFFNLTTFQHDLAHGVQFFSRYKVGPRLYAANGQALNLEQVLAQSVGQPLDLAVQLGAERLPCRLLALPVAAPVEAERRRRIKHHARRKARPVSQRVLALAGWTLYVTSLPVEQLRVEEAPILAMTRWQIERLFRLWKSSGLLDEWRSTNPWRVWCEFYAKLIAVVVQHWLTLVGCWQRLDRSLHRAAQLIRKQALHLAVCLPDRTRLGEALTQLAAALRHVTGMSKRATHPLTFQHWLETVHG